MFMIFNLVLLAVFWATIWNFTKWVLVGYGIILMLVSLILLVHTLVKEEGRSFIAIPIPIPRFVYRIIKIGDKYDLILSSILAIPGLLFTVPWLFIPYWNVCQWIVFSMILILTIISCFSYRHKKADVFCRNKVKYKVLMIMFLSITFVWTLLLFVKYAPESLFMSITSIWKIILLAVLSVFICILIFGVVCRILELCVNHRRRELCWKLKAVVDGMPIPDNSVFDNRSEKLAKKSLKRFRYLNKKMKKSKNQEEQLRIKDKLFEQKLYTFYEICLRAESMADKNAYSQFEIQLKEAKVIKDVSVLRKDIEEHKILGNLPTTEMEFVLEWKSKINKIILGNKDYSLEMQEIQNMNTSSKFLFWIYTSSSKVAKQTEKYKKLHNSMIAEFRKIQKAQDVLNRELIKIRLIAYRNIYLGVELLNYCKDNVGGKYLTTEKGSFEITNQFKELIREFDIHNFDKEEMSRVQTYIKNEISKIESQLLKGRGQLARTLEIMEAIIRFNNKFYCTYAPLRNKVFSLKYTLDEQDSNNIIRELTAFKNISIKKL